MHASPRLRRLLAALLLGLLAPALALASDPLDEPEDETPPPRRKAEIEPPPALKARGRIAFATDDAYPPMEYWDHGKLRGLDVDVGKAVARVLGLEAEFVSTPWESLLALVEARKVDAGISSIDVTPERSERLAFVEYLTLRQVMVVREGAAKPAKPEDLAGRTVAVQAGTTSEALARKHAAEGVTTCASAELAFDALKKGKVDAVVVDEPVAAHMARMDPKSFDVAGPATEGTPVGIALPKGDEALVKAVSGAVARLREKGELGRIAEKWLGEGKAEHVGEAKKPASPK